MAQQRAKFQFPVKGVVKTLGYESAPPDAMVDSLNVLPFDRSGHMRLSQRPGVQAVYASPIGTQPVKAMQQVTLGAAAGTLIGAPVSFTEPDGLGDPGDVKWADDLTRDDSDTDYAPRFNLEQGWMTVRGDGNSYTDCITRAVGSFSDSLGTRTGRYEAGQGPAGQPVGATPGLGYPTDWWGALAPPLVEAQALFFGHPGAPIYPTPSFCVNYDDPAFVLGDDSTCWIYVNMDEAPTGSTAFLTRRLPFTVFNGTGLSGIVTLKITDGTDVEVVLGNPETADPEYSKTYTTPLTGWIKLQIDTVTLTTAAAATRIHHFYVNGVKLYSAIMATTPGTVDGLAQNTSLYDVWGGRLGDDAGSLSFDQFYAADLTIGTPSAGLGRSNKVIYVVNGNVVVGDLNSASVATNGTLALDPLAYIVSIASSSQKSYIVDGTNTKVLDWASTTVSSLTATAGAFLTKCRLVCIWRDRLILAAPDGDEQNFIMSRVGTHTDFDISLRDPAAAFSGNASTAGRIGDPIIALIPASDDLLYIATDHQIWVVRGDPADGGSIDALSDISILGPNAWCKDANGTVYLISTSGLYRIPGGGHPEPLTHDKWNEIFRTINRAENYVAMASYQDRQGMFIFISPIDGSFGTHLWWDSRLESLWPLLFAVGIGPVSAMVYDGDDPADRQLMMGGWFGDVFRMTEIALTDDGAGVTSYAYLGPYTPGDDTEVVMEWLDIVMSRPIGTDVAADTHVTVKVMSGQTAEQAFAAPQLTRTREIARPGRQGRWLNRTRGASFFIKLLNETSGKTWAMEKMDFAFGQGGVVRRH